MSDDKGGYKQINKSLNICAFEDYLKGQTANLEPIPDVEQVTERVIRVRGPTLPHVDIYTCILAGKLTCPKACQSPLPSDWC